MQLDPLDIAERTGAETTPGLAGKDLLRVIAKVREVVELLNNLPEVGELPDLATVATSGKYADLLGLPTIPAAYTNAMAIAAAQGPADTAAAGAVTLLRSGVASAGDTLAKLYSLVLGAASQVNVATLAARNAYNVPKLPFNIFVTDDGDGKWALYGATSTGVGAGFVKLSDPDLLNAVMSAAQIQAAYESNADTFRLTAAIKQQITDAASDAKKALLAKVELPLAYTEATAATSYFKITTTIVLNPDTGEQEKVVTEIDLNIDTIANAVLARQSGSGAGSTMPVIPDLTFSALTGSTFQNKEAINGPLTYDGGPPPFFLSTKNDWAGGFNTGKWPLRLPAGKTGALRHKIVDTAANLCGLTLRTIDTLDHSKGVVNCELYQLNGKVGYVINGVDTTTDISIAAGEYLLMYIAGSTVIGYRSVDGVARTQEVVTFTVTPATQALYPGQNGHFESKLYSAEQANFESYQ